MISRHDPDDAWGRFFSALKDRQTTHTRDVMTGNLEERAYAAATARVDEIDKILELARAIRRNEDITGPRQDTESVASQYDA